MVQEAPTSIRELVRHPERVASVTTVTQTGQGEVELSAKGLHATWFNGTEVISYEHLLSPTLQITNPTG